MRKLMTMTRSVAALTALMASTVGAQVAAGPVGFTRLSVAPDAARTTPVVQRGGNRPTTKWSIAGGIATGDTGMDLGFALQGSYKTTPVGWPVAIRVDPFIGRWSGGDEFFGNSLEFSMTMFGVQGNVAYDFPASGGMNWFVFGGLGLFYSTFSYESNDIPGFDADANSTDLGIGIGGGLNFSQRLVIEAQFKSIGGFTTVPILFGIRL